MFLIKALTLFIYIFCVNIFACEKKLPVSSVKISKQDLSNAPRPLVNSPRSLSLDNISKIASGSSEARFLKKSPRLSPRDASKIGSIVIIEQKKEASKFDTKNNRQERTKKQASHEKIALCQLELLLMTDIQARNETHFAKVIDTLESAFKADFHKTINKLDANNWSLLHHAVYNACQSIIKLLIEKGIDVNVKEGKQGWTPLHLAVFLDNHEIVYELLKSAKIKPDIKDNFDHNVLDIAAKLDSFMPSDPKSNNIKILLSRYAKD